MDKPLCLISVDKRGDFVIGKEAIKFLNSIDGPIGIVSVAGLARTGKSYLLNRLLNRQSGFDVGPTTNPCTKGIYIWGDSIPIRNENGDMTLVIMDTEGLRSVQQDQTYDSKIFSLSILLSTYFIYNSIGTIDENALENLHLIVNLTRHIHVRSGSSSKKELVRYLPNFLWVVRDFVLDLRDEHDREITERDYLEKALVESSISTEKNEVRRAIKEFFPDRNCVCLVRPVTDERQLRSIDTIKYNKLRPEFTSKMENITAMVYSTVTPKIINDNYLNGRTYVALMQNYINAINSGTVPTISAAWTSITLIENRKLVDVACKRYYQKMRAFAKNIPMEEDLFLESSKEIYHEILEYFHANTLGDENLTEYTKMIKEYCDEKYNTYSEKNIEASAKLCQNILNGLYEKFGDKIRSNEITNFHDFSGEWNKMASDYIQKATGSRKYVAWFEFQKFAINDTFLYFVNTLVDKLNEEKRGIQSNIDSLNSTISTLKDQLRTAESEIERKITRTNEENKSLQNEARALRKSVKSKEKQISDLENQLQQAIKEAEKIQSNVANQDEKLSLLGDLKKKVNSYKEQLKNKDKKIQSLSEELAESASFQKKNTEDQLMIQKLQKKLQSQDRKRKISSDGLSAEKKNSHKLEIEIENLKSEKDAIEYQLKIAKGDNKKTSLMNEKLKENEDEITKLENENSVLKNALAGMEKNFEDLLESSERKETKLTKHISNLELENTNLKNGIFEQSAAESEQFELMRKEALAMSDKLRELSKPDPKRKRSTTTDANDRPKKKRRTAKEKEETNDPSNLTIRQIKQKLTSEGFHDKLPAQQSPKHVYETLYKKYLDV